MHDAKISWQHVRYGIEVQIDSLWEENPKSWVVISRGLDTDVTDISAGCKQSVHPETTAQQDASSSAELSEANIVDDTVLRCRSKWRWNNHGTVESSVQDQGFQFPPPSIALRNPMLERHRQDRSKSQ